LFLPVTATHLKHENANACCLGIVPDWLKSYRHPTHLQLLLPTVEPHEVQPVRFHHHPRHDERRNMFFGYDNNVKRPKGSSMMKCQDLIVFIFNLKFDFFRNCNVAVKIQCRHTPSRCHLNPLHALRLRQSLPDRIRLMHRCIGFPCHKVTVPRLRPHITLFPRHLAT
jgi:hypothetical protein